MVSAAPLSQRIRAEFDLRANRLKAAEQERARESREEEARLERFATVCEELKGVWGPRLEEFAQQFGDAIKVIPKITPSSREAHVVFMSDLANMTLTLTASANADITKVVLDYDLLIIPILFEHQRYSRLEVPLDRVDKAAVGKWIDDQLVSCVKTYLAVQDNELYLERSMVEDPISRTRFLKRDAAATLEHNRKTMYFASDETLREYKKRHQITT